jgi:hypothetical protein
VLLLHHSVYTRKIAKSDYYLRRVFLSFCPYFLTRQLGFHWTDFHEILFEYIFFKCVQKIQVTSQCDKEWRVLYMKTDKYFSSYLAQFFIQWKISQTKAVEKIKTQILNPTIFFPRKSWRWDNVKKILLSRVGHIKIWRLYIACCVPKATKTHSEYVCNN